MHGLKELFESGFVVIDLETTGFPTDSRVEIIEVAILGSDGEPLLDTLVKPKWRIPAGASRVNGIYDDDVIDAPPLSEVYPQILETLQGLPAIAYNAPFEEGIFDTVSFREDLPAPGPLGWFCAMRGYKSYAGLRRFVKLTQACASEGIKVQNAHRAMGDCLMTLELLKRMRA